MAITRATGQEYAFNGEWNEKNILIHAIKYLHRPNIYETVYGMFQNIKDEGKLSYAESVLLASNLFEISNDGVIKMFALNPGIRQKVSEKGIIPFVDEYFFERDMQKQEKSAKREKLWYESAEAERRFNDYDRIVKNENRMFWATLISIAVSLIALIVSLSKHT